MARIRHRSPRARSGPKRDVTWGFRAFGQTFTAGLITAEWVAAPARSVPDGAGIVPQLPTDVTLIRTLPVFQAAVTVPMATSIEAAWLGLIAWGGTDAGTPPTDFPDPADGAWDWIWRAPLLAVAPPGAGGVFLRETAPAPVWTDIHSQRKFGQDLGLLWAISLEQSTVDWNISFDVRYAIKLPW